MIALKKVKTKDRLCGFDVIFEHHAKYVSKETYWYIVKNIKHKIPWRHEHHIKLHLRDYND
jgi:hypothetical protein